MKREKKKIQTDEVKLVVNDTKVEQKVEEMLEENKVIEHLEEMIEE